MNNNNDKLKKHTVKKWRGATTTMAMASTTYRRRRARNVYICMRTYTGTRKENIKKRTNHPTANTSFNQMIWAKQQSSNSSNNISSNKIRGRQFQLHGFYLIADIVYIYYLLRHSGYILEIGVYGVRNMNRTVYAFHLPFSLFLSSIFSSCFLLSFSRHGSKFSMKVVASWSCKLVAFAVGMSASVVHITNRALVLWHGCKCVCILPLKRLNSREIENNIEKMLLKVHWKGHRGKM